jgi:hypothetical protein
MGPKAAPAFRTYHFQSDRSRIGPDGFVGMNAPLDVASQCLVHAQDQATVGRKARIKTRQKLKKTF